MGLLESWRKARGAVLRRDYEDAMARMSGANSSARAAFLNNLHQTVTEVVAHYSGASPAERKAFLRDARKQAIQMWSEGGWPSSLGFGIACLSAESRFVPGDDAAFVRRETDLLIREAEEAARRPR